MLRNSYSNDNIENIILRHSARGMNVLRNHIDNNFCEKAVNRLLEKSGGTVFLFTGFYVAGYAETDGPVGTYFLSKALKKIGYKPVIITDKFCEGFFDKDMDVIYMPIEHNNNTKEYKKIINKYKPVCFISIERCGQTQDNDYLNMRGISIKANTSPIDQLFNIAGKDILTIGIGDGGNEIGMGNLFDVIASELNLTPTVVKTDELIVATVSNWGAYGIIAYLQKYTKSYLLPMISDVKSYLTKIIDVGSIDGVTKEKTHSVDGFSLKIEKDILERLHHEVNINSFNSFTMSKEYTHNSRSQFSIGERVIDRLLEYMNKKEATLLDIGCGPGNLTNTLYQRLQTEHTKVQVSAVDIDSDSIMLAQENYKDVKFEVNDIYSFTNKNSLHYDYLFSNETLHWMPKIPLKFYTNRNIIYYFFHDSMKAKYQKWALSCYKKSFENIRKLLKKDGMAFLQFGLDGQLEQMYSVINQVMNECFHDKCLNFKLPLYYPTKQELTLICEKNGFEIVEMVNKKEPLYEKNTKDILLFLKAFLENNLNSLMGESDTNKLFQLVEKELLNRDLKEFIENQWNHVILIIRRMK